MQQLQRVSKSGARTYKWLIIHTILHLLSTYNFVTSSLAQGQSPAQERKAYFSTMHRGLGRDTRKKLRFYFKLRRYTLTHNFFTLNLNWLATLIQLYQLRNFLSWQPQRTGLAALHKSNSLFSLACNQSGERGGGHGNLLWPMLRI